MPWSKREMLVWKPDLIWKIIHPYQKKSIRLVTAHFRFWCQLFRPNRYRVRTKYWPPYDTNYGLFLIVLWKNYEKISHSLGLDDLFATSKPNKCEIFHNFFIKRSEIGHILYYMGGQYFVRTLYVYSLRFHRYAHGK